MASIPHSTLALGGASASALDYLSSRNGISGIPLRTLGRARFTPGRRDLTVTARLKKVKKKFDGLYPKDPNPDPNVKGGILSYLSKFKPLEVPPKPVILEFEKSFVAVEKKIAEVKKLAGETGLDFSEPIQNLERKLNEARRKRYLNLTPIQRVNIARHPNRPTFLDHIINITDKFVELHGDRAGYDDPAIVTGIGSIDGKTYMFIGHQKGRNSKENIKRNFGMPTPHGYRKALRMFYYAEKHNFPIVTFIDTPGAYADLACEHKGQGEAIAQNLRTMFGLKVPIISIVIGEGGSGGALAIGCANTMLMLENGVYFVASPEACAAILYKSSTEAPKAAKKLKITAKELVKLQIADGIILEPIFGAHTDPLWTSQQIKIAIKENMTELEKMSEQELLEHRMAKFRKLGQIPEDKLIDPKKKVNMKKRDTVIFDTQTLEGEVEGEVEKLKEQILNAKEIPSEEESSEEESSEEESSEEEYSEEESSEEEYSEEESSEEESSEEESSEEESSEEESSEEDGPSTEVLNEKIKQLRSEIDEEYVEATRAMGSEERLREVQEELLKASSKDHPVHPALKEKIAKLHASVSDAPNYESLNSKLKMLMDLSNAKAESEVAWLRKEINKRFQGEIAEKVDAVKAEVASSGASSFDELSDELKEKVLKIKGEVEEEMKGVFKSMGLDPEEQTSLPKESLLEKQEKLDKEIIEKIEEVARTPMIRKLIKFHKVETAKASKPGGSPKIRLKKMAKLEKLKQLERLIKQMISKALSESGLPEKVEELQKEIEKVDEQRMLKIFNALNMPELQEKQEELEKEIVAARVAAEESNGSLKDDGSESGKPKTLNSKFA